MTDFMLLAILAAFTAGMTPDPPRRIVFFGDSITQAAVQSGGYIRLLESRLEEEGMAGKVQLTGAGISGNKVYDLYLRHEEDVLALRPDRVLIYIGINDVWHKRTHGTGTDADKFERFYEKLIDRIAAGGADIVLCTPTVIGERKDLANDLDEELERYSGIVRQLAARKNIPLVDLRKSFQEYLLEHNTANAESGILTTDGVHLNAAGNRLVAEMMWPFVSE